MTAQYVFSFDEGDGKNKQLLGGKGANLCEMTQIGLNVPPGFVISTAACLAYLKKDQLPKGLLEQVQSNISLLEKKTGKRFGDAKNPLLVSVRSGSALSMPGMMDTILNLGLNQKTLQGVIKQTKNPRFAFDAYRRFIQLFSKVALGIDDEQFDLRFVAIKKKVGAVEDVDLSCEDLKLACQQFLQVVEEHTGKPFPEDVNEQLRLSIQAVFKSWGGKRAVDYRREFKITPNMADGTAVNIVTMVFGNMGNDSATGVGFTRNPGTGENKMFGEYLTNAQGEDVVAGIRTPKPVQELATEMPEMYTQLETLREKLELHYHEVQDFEYTIEKGKLYCLQTRNGKMNATAMIRSSVEMAKAGLITKKQALARVDPSSLEQVLHPRLDPNKTGEPLAQGLPASPGAASGICVFDADRAEIIGRSGEKVILVREETKPEDIHGFFASQGILTSRGGKTSHAAVVARGMGKACVAGAESIKIDVRARQAVIGDRTLREGDVITIDGASGYVYAGELPTLPPQFTTLLKILLTWADKYAVLKVMANADTPKMAKKALEYGAMGIGLCRTERMFNATERLPIVVDMILADSLEERQEALDRLLPIQQTDFKKIFETMSPHPVTIRLLDPPIHEFLPSENELKEELRSLQQYREELRGKRVLSNSLSLLHEKVITGHGLSLVEIEAELKLLEAAISKKRQMLIKVREISEVNPMLGHRGVRLGITYPEIYKMQIRAVLEANADCIEAGIDTQCEIMVPQVSTAEELIRVKSYVAEVQAQVEGERNIKLKFKFGSMIEVVRACMRAGHLAEYAEFFSFGTNDLTQATFSFSREDAENKFLPMYNEQGILQDNPFEILDTKGVGRLMETTVKWGRSTRKNLKIGICGEQGGHPDSIDFCHNIGLNYISCSAPRVPIARLAAAQSALKKQ